MGSVVKKRRKKISKHKHRKLLKEDPRPEKKAKVRAVFPGKEVRKKTIPT